MSVLKTKIALVCPGGPITRDLAVCIREIADARYGDQIDLFFHEQCFKSAGHFAGTDAERSAALVEVANDDSFDAVWFARGGYGACRLDDAIWGKLNESARRKTYLGYSDAGIILARLYKEAIGAPVHGPMPTDVTRDGGVAAIERTLDYLSGATSNSLEKTARDGSNCAAFNITVLSHMINAPWFPALKDHIIMLEDVGEYLYRIDRSMFTIAMSSAIHNAAGVMVGRISAVPENDRPFGQSDEEIIAYWCARAGVPYLGRADIGHDSENKIVPFGHIAHA